MIAHAIYPITDDLLQWLTQSFLELSESTFFHFRMAGQLLPIVEAVEARRLPVFAAMSAIKRFNEENDANYTYEELRDLDASFIFADAGEWTVFTDDPEAIIRSPHQDVNTILTQTVGPRFVLLWDTDKNLLHVLRSPDTAGRERLGEDNDGLVYTRGLKQGNVESYVLPPKTETEIF